MPQDGGKCVRLAPLAVLHDAVLHESYLERRGWQSRLRRASRAICSPSAQRVEIRQPGARCIWPRKKGARQSRGACRRVQMLRCMPSSLSDLGSVGYKSAAAVRFSPPSWPIAGLWACESGKNCPRWGRFSLSTPQVRQAASSPRSSARSSLVRRPGNRASSFSFKRSGSNCGWCMAAYWRNRSLSLSKRESRAASASSSSRAQTHARGCSPTRRPLKCSRAARTTITCAGIDSKTDRAAWLVPRRQSGPVCACAEGSSMNDHDVRTQNQHLRPLYG